MECVIIFTKTSFRLLRTIANDSRFDFGRDEYRGHIFVDLNRQGFSGLFYHFRSSHNYSVDKSVHNVCVAKDLIRAVEGISRKVKFCFSTALECPDPHWKNHYHGKVWLPFAGSEYDFRLDYMACHGDLGFTYRNKWRISEDCITLEDFQINRQLREEIEKIQAQVDVIRTAPPLSRSSPYYEIEFTYDAELSIWSF